MKEHAKISCYDKINTLTDFSSFTFLHADNSYVDMYDWLLLKAISCCKFERNDPLIMMTCICSSSEASRFVLFCFVGVFLAVLIAVRPCRTSGDTCWGKLTWQAFLFQQGLADLSTVPTHSHARQGWRARLPPLLMSLIEQWWFCAH